ncbi:MAG: hypothetical protein EWV83_09830 [Microcystis sp. M_OC_Ca_00000000_S217Cul]|nr:MAG: hypothetical protein EWV83_09830 [Microcystis sp. M_OC_Ca_00000000_S217Cul]TRT83275.1 MAG: hypothetical protein EWV66_23140 [Microcystis sp. M_OC_Ca_00000000_C217Col]
MKFPISPFPHFPISPFPHFPISPFPHFSISPFPHLTRSFALSGLTPGCSLVITGLVRGNQKGENESSVKFL